MYVNNMNKKFFPGKIYSQNGLRTSIFKQFDENNLIKQQMKSIMKYIRNTIKETSRILFWSKTRGGLNIINQLFCIIFIMKCWLFMTFKIFQIIPLTYIKKYLSLSNLLCGKAEKNGIKLYASETKKPNILKEKF